MKNIVNQMKLTFSSRSANESFARTAAAAFVAQLDPTIEEMNDIKTAVSEAVTNAIVHGYRDRDGNIAMQIKIYDDNMVHITVSDKGCGIPDVDKAREPLYTTGGSDRSGMGFTIMESFTDRLAVSSAQFKGTTVKMQKRIKPKYTGRQNG